MEDILLINSHTRSEATNMYGLYKAYLMTNSNFILD